MQYRFPVADLEMLTAFVEEASDYLQKMEEQVIKLETAGETKELLKEVFRQMHTLKGMASFFGFADISQLSHQAENLLDALRSEQLSLDHRAVDLLLEAVDALGEMLAILQRVTQDNINDDWLKIELTCSRDLNLLINRMQFLVQQSKEKAIQKDCIEELAPATAVLTREEEKLLHKVKLEAFPEMTQDFLLEADEHLTVITNQLLIDLDNRPEDFGILAEVFRRVHTMKGALGLLHSVTEDEAQLIPLLKINMEILQLIEEVLEWVRDNLTTVPAPVIDMCFQFVDNFRLLMAEVETGQVVELDTVEGLQAKFQQQKKQLMHAGQQVKPMKQNTAREPAAVNQPGIASSNSIRVSEDKVNRLMNAIGELVVTKNAFTLLARKLMLDYNLAGVSKEVKEIGQWLARLSSDLEDAIMSMRMTEVKVVFQKFPRIIRDIGQQTGKRISLVMQGEDTEMDKNIIDQISDPLMHLVRNAADHGIETEEQRIKAGKEPQGKIWLRAYNRGNYVIIEVEDDGRGICPDSIREKAVEKGFIAQDQVADMTDEQALQLVFLPGFSTAKNVSEISGRGVGMDVVNSNVTALQGKVMIDSVLGRGTKFTLQLPLTLVVSRGLMVEAGGQLMVMPLEQILEAIKVPGDRLITRKGKKMLYHRGAVLGVIHLGKLLGLAEEKVLANTPIVVITNGGIKVGVTVDKLLAEQDVLVKPLPDYLAHLPGMGGATIMGDGKLALVLNSLEIINMAVNNK